MSARPTPIAERRLAKPSYQATTPGRASRCTRGTNENEPSRGSLFPLHDSERLPSDGQCSRAVFIAVVLGDAVVDAAAAGATAAAGDGQKPGVTGGGPRAAG